MASMLRVLKGEMNRQELQEELGLKDRFYFRDSYINPGLKSGVIEMTQPDSPRSPTQKYRLTEKGIRVLEKFIPR
ncbi:Fic family protein [Desulfonatronovibrio hydrogenovorans]|uniref:Fic family protein n=1 Tax=Desulfonatronovibrio hydrogenovorans TaxID=53245 RepID=UPI00307FC4B9